jgi:prephenate dehydrogenase
MSAPGFRQFDTLAVVGLGLIGGSLAMDVRRLGLAKRILGYDHNSKYRAEISRRNLVDYLAEAPDANLAEAQLVMLAVPVKAFADVLSNIRPHLSASVILTDTGSVKSTILQMMRAPEYAGIRFVGGHPIAGSENFGPHAARENLFAGKRCILTPETDTDRDVVRTVCDMWESMGSMVSEMDAEDHDQMFASVSHLPHLLAYASIMAIADSSAPEALSYSGAGLTDFSRIASSSPEMWADIFLENQENLLSCMNTFKDVVAKLENAIKRNDKEKLIELLAQAKTERDRWMT